MRPSVDSTGNLDKAGLRPDPHASISDLAAAAEHCERCPLYRRATQLVFGEGPAPAVLMLVGEQPGDPEDRIGHPFVGPAGRLLDEALAAAGLDRRALYITNAVKHFKHELRGKHRLHRKPNQGEVKACRWWLRSELAVVRPKLVVALGATAARSVMNRTVVLARERGAVVTLAEGCKGMVTLHPSAILRMPDGSSRAKALTMLIADLAKAAQMTAADNAFG